MENTNAIFIFCTEMRAIIFSLIFFLSGNYVVTDLLGFTNSIKNGFVGFLLYLIFLISFDQYKKVDTTLLMVLAGILPSLALNGFALSLYVLFFAVLIFAICPLSKGEFIKILRIIFLANVILLFIVYVQAILIFMTPGLLKYSYPVVESDFSANGEIIHWIQRLGVMTQERIWLFGRQLPRFSGFMTEPSAFVFAAVMPAIFLDDMDKKRFSRIWAFVPYLFLSRSTFLFGIIIGYLVLRSLVKITRVKYARVIMLLSVAFFLMFLPVLFARIADYLEFTEFFFLTNKTHSFQSRLNSILTVLESVSLTGVKGIELNGMPLTLFWLGKFGIIGLMSLLFFFERILHKNQSKTLFFVVLYALLFLSKGWITLLFFIIITSYAKFSPSSEYSQAKS